MTEAMHIVLLGDSIFDNASYTRGGPAVISQLEQLLPQGGRASLLARGGASTDEVASQLRRVPSDATHLVLSVGGNDALENLSVIDTPAHSTAQALGTLAGMSRGVEGEYRRAVAACQPLGPPPPPFSN